MGGQGSFKPPDSECAACAAHWKGFKHVEVSVIPLIDRLNVERRKTGPIYVWKAESTEEHDLGTQYDMCPCCNGFCCCATSPSKIENCTCKCEEDENDPVCADGTPVSV